MQTPYSSPAIPWPFPLFTRKTISTKCALEFDFDWHPTIRHDQPNFSGLHDLSQAVDVFAKACGKTSVLLLSDKADVPFDEITTDIADVAVFNVKDFRAAVKNHDRSAIFFLSAISKHGSISTVSFGSAMPIRVNQLLKALEVGMEERPRP